MRWRFATAADDSARAARLAWLVSFLATLLLIALLALARSAQAHALVLPGDAGTAGAALAFDEEAEEEETESQVEAELEEEEEGEEGEEDLEPPFECFLRTAQATIVAYESQSKIQLRVNYTSFAPADVAVDYSLHGGKGSLDLGRERKHFAYTGVFLETDKLSKAQMARVMAAREFTVQLQVLPAPSSCHHYFARHLKGKRATHGKVTWSQSDSVFGS